MAERYTKIFSLKNGICEKGLPIKINAGALLRDNATGKLLVQLKIQNAQKKTLTLVRVKILQGREQAALDFEYKDLSVAKNGEFGVQTPIFLTSEKAKTFSVTVTGVKFEDGTVWIPAKALKQAPTETIRQTKPTPVSAPVKNPSPSRAPAEAAAKTSPAPDENKIKENDLLYNSAIELAHSGNIDSIKKAIKQFEAVRGWKDADKYILACRKKIAELEEQARAASMTRAKAEVKTKADSENSETKPKKKRKKIIFGLLLLGIVLGIIAVIFATCNRTIDVTEISLNNQSIYLDAGESVDLTVKVSPNDATDKSVTWKSSNTDVVTVSEGKATAVGTGSATITVTTLNGKTATCTVIVTNPLDDFKYEKNTTGYTITGVKNKNETSYVIPDSVTRIGDYAFSGCSSLTSITIPNSVTSIGGSVFYGCSGLTSVTIGNSVTSIGPYAFSRCSNLTSVTIPDSVTSIGFYAFYCCSGLTSITIPNSVTSIGGSVFYGCSGLTSITIPNSVTSIGGSAFYGCSGLTSITIPNSVTSIGDDAFRGCSGLTSVTIPDSVTSIGRSAFYGCSGLTSITIPNSVTSIDSYAFDGCRGLTSITIPNSVTSIGEGAFGDCSGLTSITIPNSVTSIDDYAFYYCYRLTSINFQGTKAQWNKITLGSGWKNISHITQIICTDGTINLD